MTAIDDMNAAIAANTDATTKVLAEQQTLLQQIATANAGGAQDTAIESAVSQLQANTTALVGLLAPAAIAPVPAATPTNTAMSAQPGVSTSTGGDATPASPMNTVTGSTSTPPASGVAAPVLASTSGANATAVQTPSQAA